MSAAALPVPAQAEFGIGLGAALLVAGLVGFGLAEVGTRPLAMELYGDLERVQPGAVRQVVDGELGQGFFGLDPKALEGRLEALAWVRRAQVERLWPDRLAVRIEEHRPLARWGEGGVLTAHGAVIEAASGWQDPDAVEVSAPAHQARRLAGEFPALLSHLAQAGAGLRRWQLSLEGDMSLELDYAGSRLRAELGREQAAERIRRLAGVALPLLRERIGRVEHIDLRYRNGFAVGWRDPGKGNS